MTKQHARTATVAPSLLINGLSGTSALQLKFLTVNCNYNLQFHFYLPTVLPQENSGKTLQIKGFNVFFRVKNNSEADCSRLSKSSGGLTDIRFTAGSALCTVRRSVFPARYELDLCKSDICLSLKF
jgi:hypothetical protein